MRFAYTLCCIAVLCVSTQLLEAKTVFRRRDKISENFKQLGLTQAEIDPNVAPPEPQKVEPMSDIDNTPASSNADTGVGAALAEEGSIQEVNGDETDEDLESVANAADTAANEIADETINEVAVETAAAPAPVTATPAAATPAEATTEAGGLSKYCKCSDSHCDCCRSLGVPLLPLRGPGCAKITYLGDEKMSISIRYGDITLATRTISSKKARPVCVGLPGGYSKFCGRVYGLAKTKDNFKACLGFELRADDEIEAALRVSCFKFGPEGLRVADAEPLPSEVIKEEEEDDDIFGFGAGGDDEDEEDYDDEDETEEADDEPEEEYDDDEEEVAAVAEAPEDVDYGGFSLAGLLEELAEDDEESSAVVKPPPVADTLSSVVRTRTVVQSKDEKGTQAAGATTNAEESGVIGDAEETVEHASTEAPKNKTKKSKGDKPKKPKKKKAATTETGLAYQILNGILDFFN